jgi:5-methylcytosine-specific restriction endonuclease McrBC GTP-binding regulatory subunit McrB
VQDNIVPFEYIKNTNIKIEPIKPMKINANPLNQILYGPPGTGKTYNAIPLALSIVEPDFAETYKNLDTFTLEQWQTIKLKYDELRNNGFIEFVTFHQSMSYEDFIEGIKPILKIEGTDDESTQSEHAINYKIEDGIFKKVAKKALEELIKALKVREENTVFPKTFDDYYSKYIDYLKSKQDDNNPYKFKMLYRGNLLLINLSDAKSIRLKYEKGILSEQPGKQEFNISSTYLKKLFESGKTPDYFKGNIQKRMIEIVGYCGQPSPYWAVYNDFITFVNSKMKNEIEPLEEKETLGGEISFDQYMDLLNEIDFNDNNVKELLKTAKPVVLIIDEINRGNIANIFGELITLIESGKRIGEHEMIRAKLPYSKTDFSVPPNLYIIGTMNTADRSVEALDTALRRRFTFIEKVPQPELLSETTDFGVDLKLLLEKINARIRVLLDKDHCIGHSYFLNIQTENDLLETFRDKLIPLLQEYFYNDFGKIRLILGDAFVELVKAKVDFAVSDNSEPEFDDYFLIKKINKDEFINSVKKIYDKSHV